MTTKAKKAVETNTFSALGEVLQSAAERFEEGTAGARDSAKQAAGTFQRALKVGLYNAAYGLSYGSVYSAIFLTELLPKENFFRRGLEEGADAAFEARAKKKAGKGESSSKRGRAKSNGR